MLKSDKRDALTLANTLYNQLEKGIQVADKTQLVRRLFPPTEAASQLKGLTRHRYELMHESTQRKNKLISICDELFPEYTQIFSDPTRKSALSIREKFPTPQAIAEASLSDLLKARVGSRPSNEHIVQLQQLARETIGTKVTTRKHSLTFEQSQLIKELHLLQDHLTELDTEITAIVEASREGHILTSMQVIGPIQAGMIIAAIGNIANFDNAAQLKSYFGWAPIVETSAQSLDYVRLTHTGNRTIKQAMFLIVGNAIRMDCEWARLYERLVVKKCRYDERTRTYKGKKKVMGRVAGQMIEMMYAFLKRDYETLSKLQPGETPPEPMLYDPTVHHKHRTGEYISLKPINKRRRIVLLPPT